MGADDVARHGQPDAGAANRVEFRRVAADEALEDLLSFAGRDPEAFVADVYLEVGFRPGRDADVHDVASR
jgi:hypothetical protein